MVAVSSFDYGVCAYLIVSSMKQCRFFFADLAHLVERHLAKVEVASSSLVIRSRKFVVEIFTAFLLFTDNFPHSV